MKRGRSIAGQLAVMALFERHDRPNSRVRLHVLHSLRNREVQGVVRNNVEGVPLCTPMRSTPTAA